MDKKTLIKYQSYCMDITNQSYLTSLKELLNNKEYYLFHDVIQYMLENKIRLEQEIII